MMEVQGRQIVFDVGDMPLVAPYRWKAPGKADVCSSYRDENGIGRTITLHKLLTGSKHIRWVNGDKCDYRRENIVSSEKMIQRKEKGVYLKGNKYQIESGDLVIFVESKGETHEFYADLDDYSLLSQYTWSRNPRSGYARTIDRVTREDIYMHRLVMGAVVGSGEIDHINGLPYDNRKKNLRFCTSSQNKHNNGPHRDGTAGVSRHVGGGWDCRLQVNGVIHRKYFTTFDEAVAQYRAWEQEFNPSGLQ